MTSDHCGPFCLSRSRPVLQKTPDTTLIKWQAGSVEVGPARWADPVYGVPGTGPQRPRVGKRYPSPLYVDVTALST